MAETLSENELLLNIVYHVFLPPKLPQQAPSNDNEQRINHLLALRVLDTVDQYSKAISESTETWNRMHTMLSKLARDILVPLEKSILAKDMMNMQVGDVLSLYIRAQNAAAIIRKSSDVTTFEFFEAQIPNSSIMSTPGKLIRHFPGPAIQVPNSIANDAGFINEIANFLARMNLDVLKNATATTRKAGSRVAEERDTADPHYISQLLTGILRGFGIEVEPHRVIKRIADEILWDNAYLPWRRSSIWLIVRVALQTSVGSTDYKRFMIYLHAHLLGLCCNDFFSSDLLATMRIKMARRLLKIQDSAPSFLVEWAKIASNKAEILLQARWTAIQNEVPRFGPLTLDPERAIVQSLPNSREYMSKVLQGRSKHDKPRLFKPGDGLGPTAYSDFSKFENGALASLFGKHKHIALYSFENSVYNHLLAWVDNAICCKDNQATRLRLCYVSAFVSYLP